MKGGARIPTPLVATLGASMIAVGVAAAIYTTRTTASETSDADVAPAGLTQPLPVDVTDRTAIGVAESFLDAWRKRNHDVATQLSRGTAQEAVAERAATEDELDPRDRELQRVWNELAEGRLRLRLVHETAMGESHVRLDVVASGDFMERPYERQFRFDVVRDGDRFYVEDMLPGRVLSEEVDMNDVVPENDPGDFEMRGEDVP